MNSFYITVFTPTYNRSHTLHRVFESLQQQNFNDFEWLIIDDGSTDNTKELVDSFITKADFPIRYFYKENGGRHTAINLSYNYIRGRYVINIDSDDALTSNALQKIHDIWESIPNEEYNRYWCVSGRFIDSNTKSIVGKYYPENINLLAHGKKKKRIIFSTGGDKSCCRKTEIVTQYPFPVFEDTKFITENIIWEQINKKYDQYCVNDIFGIYFQDEPDSLVKGRVHTSTRLHSSYYAAQSYINQSSDQWYYNKLIIFEYINISRLSMLIGKSYWDVIRNLNTWYKKIFVTMGYPISWIYIQFNKNKENKRTESV
ncbi:glycosyltransferase family 2 protein [Peribacillus simplex]|uniref:Glycosyltransferase family 2 protein n=1 Tax=Peribacillus simplex TaxID=1478 RepID=A0A8B5XW87_9BACI|nr:glycosyltransferase family A protein [Peribacillus simplex]TVX79108.1 glycosyltransferase family 2 protein [Peribacillus simplex]